MQISHSSTRPIRNGLLKRNDCRSAGVVRKLTLRGGGVEFRASRRLIYKIALYFSEVREEDSSGCRRFGSRLSRSTRTRPNLFQLSARGTCRFWRRPPPRDRDTSWQRQRLDSAALPGLSPGVSS